MALAESPRTMTLREALDNRLIRKIGKVWIPSLSLFLLVAAFSATKVWTVPLWVVVGVLYYSLLEYVLHRFHFHNGPYGPLVRKLTYDLSKMHIDHHRIPAHPKGAVNQQKPAFVVAWVSALIALFLPIPYAISFAFIFGAAICYVGNDLIHFAVHHLPMERGILAYYKRHHMLHHYRDENSNFATVLPLWDKLFGTEYKAPQRETA